MRRFLISYIILISVFLLNYKVKSQPLTIKNVSVINEQGHVLISWEYNGTDNLEIFRDSLENANLSPLVTISPSDTSFLDLTAGAHLRSRAYQIKSETNASLSSKIVHTYYLTFKYDSCAQQINLSWRNLADYDIDCDWIPSQFIININEGGLIRTETVNAINEDYAVSDIMENTNYTIFLETFWIGQTETSYSNTVKKFTSMPQSPDYINSISASVVGSNTNLKFEIASNSELNTYKLLKSDSENGSYDTLETIITEGFEITATDYNSEPGSKVSFYKLVSVNECGNITTKSDVINNIVLEIENNEFDNILTWNLFKEERMVPVNYEIYRLAGNLEPELIGDFSNYNSFEDNIELLQSYTQFCYYVLATDERFPESEPSQSNTVCMSFEPTVYIPEAFTPNDDGLNDCFKICGNFEVSSFNLRIYDRWSTKIFESNRFTPYTACDECSDDSWFGKDKNGNSVPTGVYIYLLKIKLPNEQVIEKSGNIIVIYP